MQNEINVQKLTNNIKHIVEKALGQKISKQPNAKDLLIVDAVKSTDQLADIKYFLENPQLINQELLRELVSDQLNKYQLNPIHALHPPVYTWKDYLSKLNKILAEVKFRKANNYEFSCIMPSASQIRELKNECWLLTQQHYEGHGNLSCFYAYFIAMNQAAGITCFEYETIGKSISNDGYLSLINRQQRLVYHQQHDRYIAEYIKQGAQRAHGRSVIDATEISNLFYHKHAQLIFMHEYAKQLVLQHVCLDNYGQLPYTQRLLIWQLITQEYASTTAIDEQNIYYQYTQFLNARPGEYFNWFTADFPEAAKADPKLLHEAVKIAGLISGNIIMLQRDIVADWVPKRHFLLEWQRIYDLKQIKDSNTTNVVRAAASRETARILPNELPYAPGHGLSLCGTGLNYASDQITYEWNSPVDAHAEIDNWPRDIEKLFREFALFIPRLNHKNSTLEGEQYVNMFHNQMAYSTIHTTQHTHLITTPLEQFPIYDLPAQQSYVLHDFGCKLEIVFVGHERDALYLRFIISDPTNEELIKFLIDFNLQFFKHFDGERNVDVHLHLFTTLIGETVFIYQPHAFLVQLDNDKFMHPDTKQVTVRRPQFVQPEGEDISAFNNEMAKGLPYWRDFFDATCKPGVYSFISDFIRSLAIHP